MRPIKVGGHVWEVIPSMIGDMSDSLGPSGGSSGWSESSNLESVGAFG